MANMSSAHHTPYRGLELRESGERVALEVVRHRNLFGSGLGLSWSKVHDEYERWEHVLSEEVEQLMMGKLGHSARDPHGARHFVITTSAVLLSSFDSGTRLASSTRARIVCLPATTFQVPF